MSNHLEAFPALKGVHRAPVARTLGVHSGAGRAFTAVLTGGAAPGSVVFTSNFAAPGAAGAQVQKTSFVFAPSGDVYATYGVAGSSERLAVHNSPSGAMSMVPPPSGTVQNPAAFLAEQNHSGMLRALSEAFKGLAAAGSLDLPAAQRDLSAATNVVGAVRPPPEFPGPPIDDVPPGRIGEGGVPRPTKICVDSVVNAKPANETKYGHTVYKIVTHGYDFKFIKSVNLAFIVLFDANSYAVYLWDKSVNEFTLNGGVYSKLEIQPVQMRGKKKQMLYILTDEENESRTFEDGPRGAVVFVQGEQPAEEAEEEEDEDEEEEDEEETGAGGLGGHHLELPPGDLRQPLQPTLRRMMIDTGTAAPSGGMVRLCDLP